MRIRSPRWLREARAAVRRQQLEDGLSPTHVGPRIGAKVVPAEEFVSLLQAKEELGVRFTGTVALRANAGYLTRAARDSQSKEWAVTRTSLDVETRWRSAASRLAKVKRGVWTLLLGA